MTNEVNRTRKKNQSSTDVNTTLRWLEIVFLVRENWVPIHAVTCGSFRVWEERKNINKDGGRFRVALDFAPAK